MVARFLLTRLGLAVVTLILLSIIVFVGAQLMPGNVAVQILGNTADPRAIAKLNQQLGLDQPPITPATGAATAVTAAVARAPTRRKEMSQGAGLRGAVTEPPAGRPAGAAAGPVRPRHR